MMNQRITRRVFAKAGAMTTLGATSLAASGAAGSLQASGAVDSAGATMLEVRPYQLLCIVCRLGEGKTSELGDVKLSEILAAVQRDCKIPIRLRCNVDTVYRYQNPGPAEDTAEGELFNAKRDLDVLQKLGLAPGDARPAIDIFERLLAKIPTVKGVCGYETVTADTWRGCARAASGNYERGHAQGVKAIIPLRGEEEKANVKEASVAAMYHAKKLNIRPHHLMCMSCFYGRSDKLAPIQEDNLFEAIDVIHKNPNVPVTLIAGCCVICPPCSRYEPKSNLCLGGKSMALRDQKKDLDVLQKTGLKYGDTLPAKRLYTLLYDRIPSTVDICGYGDGKARAHEWSVCDGAENDDAYRKARKEKLGIKS